MEEVPGTSNGSWSTLSDEVAGEEGALGSNIWSLPPSTRATHLLPSQSQLPNPPFINAHICATFKMIAPFSRRALLPLVLLFCFLVVANNLRKISVKGTLLFYKFLFQVPIPSNTDNKSPSIHLAIPTPSHGVTASNQNIDSNSEISRLPLNRITTALLEFASCPLKPNQYTKHIRLPNLLYNISMSARSGGLIDKRTFWNPTILALPYWAKNQYLLVSMVAPDTDPFRRNVMCEANICHPKSHAPRRTREKICSDEDIALLGPNGGLRCVNPPAELNVPPTPAARCDGDAKVFSDIPGFHDPRIFYTGRGEPILMVSSQ